MRVAKNRGFTLIEVMIALTILGALTVMTASSIQQALKAKTKIEKQIDDISEVRDAMRVVEKDINLAFHYRDLETELKTALQKASGKPTTPPGSPGSSPGSSSQPNRVDPTTQFIGDGETMAFTTKNHSRTLRNTRQADFGIVGYSVKTCHNRADRTKSSNCLYRRLNPYVGLKYDEGGSETVLLENVKEFKLRYFGKGKQDWVNDWKTDARGDAVTKDNFPEAVEVSLTVENGDGDKKKKISMQMVVPIRFPNNKEPDNTTNPGMPGAPK